MTSDDDYILHIHLYMTEILSVPITMLLQELQQLLLGITEIVEHWKSWKYLDSLWESSEITELTKIMKQHRDKECIYLLNQIRTAKINDHHGSARNSKINVTQ